MADPITIKRVAHTLEETAQQTAKWAGFWEALATAALNEGAKTLTVSIGPLPAQPFLALTPDHGSLRILARGATVQDLMASADDQLKSLGQGEVWAAEIKRVWVVG